MLPLHRCLTPRLTFPEPAVASAHSPGYPLGSEHMCKGSWPGSRKGYWSAVSNDGSGEDGRVDRRQGRGWAGIHFVKAKQCMEEKGV